jgi:hypothetical protein
LERKDAVHRYTFRILKFLVTERQSSATPANQGVSMSRDIFDGADQAASTEKLPRGGSWMQRLVRRFLVFSIQRRVTIYQDIHPNGLRIVVGSKVTYRILHLIPVPNSIGRGIALFYNPIPDQQKPGGIGLLREPEVALAIDNFWGYPKTKDYSRQAIYPR